MRNSGGLSRLTENFVLALNGMHDNYDENEYLIKLLFSSPGYHTALHGGFVHYTRNSIAYALMLLDTGDEIYFDRAFRIIERIIELQDAKPKSHTYGIWPWFSEEPLEKMAAPDFNWANFIGKELAQILLFHRNKLPNGLAKKVEKSLYHAAISIIKRNVHPNYTNIHIMGVYVTLIAGNILNDSEIFKYGKLNLKLAIENVESMGGVCEYNSPTYSIVAINDISIIIRDIMDEELRKDAEALNDTLWKMVAMHYHPSTRMLSGPHSRCYNDFMDEEFRYTIEQGLKPVQKDNNPRVSYIRYIHCPEQYMDLFLNCKDVRYFHDTYSKQSNDVATTYMTEGYALGSFNKSMFWNQRRPCIGYFNNEDKVTTFKIRVLHDDYDFCSAMPTICQVDRKAICGVNFVYEGGDTHPDLDHIKKGAIKAKSLKLRFEIGGYCDNVSLPDHLVTEKDAIVKIGKYKIFIQFLHFAFDGKEFEAITGENETSKWIDVILYSGGEKQIHLQEITNAAMIFGISIDQQANYFTRENDQTIEAGITDVRKMSAGEIRIPKKVCSRTELKELQSVRLG